MLLILQKYNPSEARLSTPGGFHQLLPVVRRRLAQVMVVHADVQFVFHLPLSDKASSMFTVYMLQQHVRGELQCYDCKMGKLTQVAHDS